MKKLLVVLFLFINILSFGFNAKAFASITAPASLPYTYSGHTYTDVLARYDETYNNVTNYYYYNSAVVTRLYFSGNVVFGTAYNGTPNYDILMTDSNGYVYQDAPSLALNNWEATNNSSNLLVSQPIYSDTSFSTVLFAANLTSGVTQQLTVIPSPSSGGTVTSSPIGLVCSSGTCTGSFAGNVTLTATPASGYAFAYWDDGTMCSNSNILTFNVSSASTITAMFGSVPSQVLSPVEGQLGTVTSDTNCGALYQQGKWCFNQHGTGAHTIGGGVGSSDDSKAWDANLNYPTYDSDNGKEVYSVESGTVTQLYAGSTNAGGTTGQVLIEHTTSNGSWWSGYLHLSNIQVAPGNPVTAGQLIGYVSQTGTNNNHLHFVVYTGENTQGKLKSVDVPIIAR